MENKKEVQISLAQKKIIKSILYPNYIILSNSYSFGRIYTTIESLQNWVYTGLEGAIIVGLEIKTKICKFFLFDLDTFEILFECVILNKLSQDNFKKGNERFYYYQIDKVFIGFEIPKIEEGSILCGVIQNLTDNLIKKTINDFPNLPEVKFNELVTKAINLFNKKLNEENKPKINASDKLIINELELEKYIDAVDLDEKNGKIIIKGNGIGGIDEVLKKIKGDLIAIDNSLKIGNRDVFERQISNNILNSYQKGILIPKRKINREGEPVNVEPKQNVNPQQSNENHIPKVPVEPINQSNNNIPKPPEISSNSNIPKQPVLQSNSNVPQPPPLNTNNIPKPPTNIPQPPKQSTNIPQPPQLNTNNIPKPPTNIPQPPKIPPVPVAINAGKGKVPVAPPIPKAPPIPINNTNVVKQPPPQPKKNTGKPLSLAEELAKKKNALKKVEIKDYVSPALKKGDEGGGNNSGNSGGGMRDELMRAMKLRKNPNPQSNINQNNNNPQKQKTNNIPEKLPINQTKVEPPKPKVEPPKQNVEPQKVNNSNSGQPIKIGGSGGFAAMRNMLANRMAPPSQKPKEPPKPIIEVASSSTTGKMDIKALISGMSKKMEGGSSGTTTTTPVVVSTPIVTPTVIGGKGPGIPPPPIPLTVPKAPTGGNIPKVPVVKPSTVPVPKGPPSVPVPKGPPSVPVPKGPPSVPVPKGPPSVPVPKGPPSVPVPKGPPSVPVPTTTGGKVPIPPPIPKAPPIPPAPKITTNKVTAPTKAPPAKKQLSMAEEMAKLKLKKVETKEKFGIKAQKESNSSGGGSTSSSAGGNSFFAQLTSVKLKKVNK